jgi:hypothetical protein
MSVVFLVRVACLEGRTVGRGEELRDVTAPGPDAIFVFHAQPVGHSVDVVEICHHLGGIVDGLVAEAVVAQIVQGLRRDGRGRRSQLLGVAAQRPVGRRQVGPAPVPGDLIREDVGGVAILDPEVPCDLGPEVVCVGPNSVPAPVDP